LSRQAAGSPRRERRAPRSCRDLQRVSTRFGMKKREHGSKFPGFDRAFLSWRIPHSSISTSCRQNRSISTKTRRCDNVRIIHVQPNSASYRKSFLCSLNENKLRSFTICSFPILCLLLYFSGTSACINTQLYNNVLEQVLIILHTSSEYRRLTCCIVGVLLLRHQPNSRLQKNPASPTVLTDSWTQHLSLLRKYKTKETRSKHPTSTLQTPNTLSFRR
jgi:hypothetical protein